MKEEAIFHGHLGLGDHIILQGAVNELSKLYDNFYVLAKHHNVRSVEVMCNEINSLNNVEVIGVKDDLEAQALSHDFENSHSFATAIRNGVHGSLIGTYASFRNQGKSFDACFYAQLGLDYGLSWGWETKEVSANNKILDLCPEGDFAFVHDDHSRGLEIKESMIKTDLPIIRPSVFADSIFQYLPLIKKAKEIHCMDSSFALMIDRTSKITAKKFLHHYMRNLKPTYKSHWKRIR